MNTRESLHTELRSGLTTGTCACAVAKACAYMLVHQQVISHVSVSLPQGENVVLELYDSNFSNEASSCSTIKDAGDDPDVTNGIEIIARACPSKVAGLTLRAGLGIGTVTKPGLAVKVGEPAINPVPLEMIKKSVNEILPEGKGIEIELSIPAGVEIAKKTFNPRLGIEGGISILGTSGIVKPMSEEALKDSLVIKLKQLAALGNRTAILSPGNYGKAFSKHEFKSDEEKTVLTSNFIGFMLEQAVRNRFKQIILIGHIGKLVKLAGGIFNTHSRIADARNEILAAHYYSYSNDSEGFKRIMDANTSEEVVEFIHNSAFWNYLAEKIKRRCEQYIYNELKVEVVVFSQKNGLLGHSEFALEQIEQLNNDR